MTAAQARADPLAPVRDALLDRARADAGRLTAAAEEEAAQVLASAQHEAEALRAQARAQGEADAAAVAMTARNRAGRQARAVVLGAESEVYEELVRRVRQSARQLRDDPAYPALLEGLGAQARVALGPDARITEAPEGGIIAVTGGRRFVGTLGDLADRALAGIPGLEGLWAR